MVDRSIGRATASIEIDFVPTDSGRRSRNSEQHYNMDLSLFRREELFEFLSLLSIDFLFFLFGISWFREKKNVSDVEIINQREFKILRELEEELIIMRDVSLEIDDHA